MKCVRAHDNCPARWGAWVLLLVILPAAVSSAEETAAPHEFLQFVRRLAVIRSPHLVAASETAEPDFRDVPG